MPVDVSMTLLNARRGGGLSVRVSALLDALVSGEALKTDGGAVNITANLPDGYAIAEATATVQPAPLGAVTITVNLDGTITALGDVSALAAVSSDQTVALVVRVALTNDEGATIRTARVTGLAAPGGLDIVLTLDVSADAGQVLGVDQADDPPAITTMGWSYTGGIYEYSGSSIVEIKPKSDMLEYHGEIWAISFTVVSGLVKVETGSTVIADNVGVGTHRYLFAVAGDLKFESKSAPVVISGVSARKTLTGALAPGQIITANAGALGTADYTLGPGSDAEITALSASSAILTNRAANHRILTATGAAPGQLITLGRDGPLSPIEFVSSDGSTTVTADFDVLAAGGDWLTAAYIRAAAYQDLDAGLALVRLENHAGDVKEITVPTRELGANSVINGDASTISLADWIIADASVSDGQFLIDGFSFRVKLAQNNVFDGVGTYFVSINKVSGVGAVALFAAPSGNTNQSIAASSMTRISPVQYLPNGQFGFYTTITNPDHRQLAIRVDGTISSLRLDGISVRKVTGPGLTAFNVANAAIFGDADTGLARSPSGEVSSASIGAVGLIRLHADGAVSCLGELTFIGSQQGLTHASLGTLSAALPAASRVPVEAASPNTLTELIFFEQGVPLDLDLTAAVTGGVAPLTYVIAGLPTGAVDDGDGTVSGTVTGSVLGTLTLSGTDARGVPFSISGAARVFDGVIVVDITGQSGTLDLVVTAPVDYAGTYTINLTDLATEPQLLRAAPAPTGTQALGETLTGRPALWAIADGETIDIERRWWKGNGPLLDQGGYAPLGLTYDCEWHSDAQEPFRIDERARYVTDPVTDWPVGGGWRDGDETTPPDPSPFLAGSFVDPATRELWACTPYTTQHGLFRRDLTTPAVRALDPAARFETINPHGAALPYYETDLDVDANSAEMQIRNNAMWFFGGRRPNMFITSPTVDWLNRSEMTSIQAYMFTLPTPWPPGEVSLMHADGSIALRLYPNNDRLHGLITTSAGATTVQYDDWFTDYYGTPSPISPTIVVTGMRRKDDITSIWTNGVQIAAGPAENAGTFTTADETSMAGFVNGAAPPANVNALVGTTFFAAYGLSDAEMTAVMDHIARAVGVPT